MSLPTPFPDQGIEERPGHSAWLDIREGSGAEFSCSWALGIELLVHSPGATATGEINTPGLTKFCRDAMSFSIPATGPHIGCTSVTTAAEAAAAQPRRLPAHPRAV